MQSRRAFLGTAVAGFAATFALPWRASAATTETIRFGLSSDIHRDIMHDWEMRIRTYIEDMSSRELDFILDLGDFCFPKPENRSFIDIFNSYPGEKYHVLGNHDIDGGFTWRQTMDYYGMDTPYYSFDKAGYHFVVLDGNNRPPDWERGYPQWIGPEQVEWLKADLASTELPTIIFSHQKLYDSGIGHIDNAEEVQRVLESGKANVIACFSGHRHVDEHHTKNGIHYLTINSMSYYWVGSQYETVRFDEETEAAYPRLKHTLPYDAPLYTVVTIEPEGRILIEARAANFIAPGPVELGVPLDRSGDAIITSAIAERDIEFAL